MKHIKKKSRISRILLVYLLGLLLLLATSPQHLPSVALILPFLILFVAIYMTVGEILRFMRQDAGQEEVNGRLSQNRRIALLIASAPTLLLVLQSIGQLTIRDLVTTIIIFIIGYFYLLRSPSLSSNR